MKWKELKTPEYLILSQRQVQTQSNLTLNFVLAQRKSTEEWREKFDILIWQGFVYFNSKNMIHYNSCHLNV